MIIIGLLITLGSLGLGLLIVGAMAHHPTGGRAMEGTLYLCVAGVVIGIVLMIVGGVIHAIA